MRAELFGLEKEEGLRHRYDWDYLVCFKYVGYKNLWGKIFGHCLLWRNVADDYCIKIDPCFVGTYIVPYSVNVKKFAEPLKKDYNCYVWGVRHEDFDGYNLPVIGTCVNVIKSMLGIRKWWIITPRQLERYIIKHQILEDRG
jgi:hypothetical protein